MLEKLEFDSDVTCISHTPSEWANDYTIYTFKITDNPIGPGTCNERSKSSMGSARLKVSFSAAQNKNIKVIMLYQMLGILEFEQFNTVIVL